MKLKYCQISCRAFNHRKRRIRKKYFNILIKIERKIIRKNKKTKLDTWVNQENINVWESFLVFEREKDW